MLETSQNSLHLKLRLFKKGFTIQFSKTTIYRQYYAITMGYLQHYSLNMAVVHSHHRLKNCFEIRIVKAIASKSSIASIAI